MMSFGYQFITDPKHENNRDKPPQGPEQRPQGDERPFRFSLFNRFSRQLIEQRSDLIFSDNDIPLLVYILHAFLLNNSLDVESIMKMTNVIYRSVGTSEENIKALKGQRPIVLARSLKGLLIQLKNDRNIANIGEYTKDLKLEDLEKFEKAVSKVAVEMHKSEGGSKRDHEGGEEEDEHVVSKENIAVREILTDLGIEFKEEHFVEDSLCTSDFYVPKADLLIEINGRSHFYPYSTRYNNYSNLRAKITRSN